MPRSYGSNVTPIVVALTPFLIWAAGVEPTDLDPELPSVAWTCAATGGGLVALLVAVAATGVGYALFRPKSR